MNGRTMSPSRPRTISMTRVISGLDGDDVLRTQRGRVRGHSGSSPRVASRPPPASHLTATYGRLPGARIERPPLRSSTVSTSAKGSLGFEAPRFETARHCQVICRARPITAAFSASALMSSSFYRRTSGSIRRCGPCQPNAPRKANGAGDDSCRGERIAAAAHIRQPERRLWFTGNHVSRDQLIGGVA